MSEIVIHLKTTGLAAVAVTTSLRKPYPGMRHTHAQALALDMVRAAAHLPGCTGVSYDAPTPETDGKAALELVERLLDPEQFGYCVNAEVRNAARRVLGIKGREGLAA